MRASSGLKVVVALQESQQAISLQNDLEYLGHRVQRCHEFSEGLRLLREWRPDLIVAEEGLGREQPDAGLRLAQSCRVTEDRVNGWPGTRTLVFVPVPDWDRFKRAQRTGAHVIVKGANFDTTIRYVQTIADGLVTDRMLGPALIGIHRYKGNVPHPNCKDCEWVGAEVSYGSSQTDVQRLTPVRIVLLNVLLFLRRGQSPSVIVNTYNESLFLKKILQSHILPESAIKMGMTRLRHDIGGALEWIGAPYSGDHFLPVVPYGARTYCLAGNRRLIHVPADDSKLLRHAEQTIGFTVLPSAE